MLNSKVPDNEYVSWRSGCSACKNGTLYRKGDEAHFVLTSTRHCRRYPGKS